VKRVAVVFFACLAVSSVAAAPWTLSNANRRPHLVTQDGKPFSSFSASLMPPGLESSKHCERAALAAAAG
jgi:hypothetical protein